MLLVAPFSYGGLALRSGKDGLSLEEPGLGETPAEVSFLFQESEGLRPAQPVHSCFGGKKKNKKTTQSAATIAVWAHVLLPYLPLSAGASTINCSSVCLGNLETVLGISDNHLGWN